MGEIAKRGELSKAGRKKAYRSAGALREAVEDYFDSITYEAEVKDENGKELYNRNSQIITEIRYAIPPSIEGLCEHIGITTRTWRNYADYEQNPKLAAVAEEAKDRIKTWLMRELNTRDKVQGIRFNLENNFGMSQKHEMELGPEARKQKPMSLSEKLDLLRTAARELEDDGS